MKHLKLTFLLTVLMSMVGIKANAHDIEVANADGKTIYYNWTNNNTELSVSYRGSNADEYLEYTGSVVIPESVTYNGKTYGVTSIGKRAFSYCEVTSITIPNSVTDIGDNAFIYCTGLTSITIPNSVTSIGINPFYCTGLTSVNIPVTDLAAFCNNKIVLLIYYNTNTPINLIDAEGKEIKDYIIPSGVTSIGNYAFYNCTGLKSINIPNSVTSIGNYAFSNCTGLKSINIPNSVTSIGESAFSGCWGLTSINISVTDLAAFCNNCSFLI